MSENSQKSKVESKKHPSLVVGAYIFNKKGELFLLKSAHWENLYAAPGGEVNYGEQVEGAVVRQVKEKTGLDIKNLDFIANAEVIESKQRVGGNVHLVSLRYRAELKNDENVLDGIEYLWLKPEEVIKNEDVREGVRDFVKKFFVDKGWKSKIKNQKSKISKCKECEEYKSGWLRAQADYKNLQKEVSEQRSQWARMSEQTILEEFIPIYDNFKLAFAHKLTESNQEIENWQKGIEYIMKQFWKVLEDHEVEEIKTVGEKFDHELHEAAGEEDSEEESGTIIKEVSAGYMMKGKVIKAARVVVSK